MKTLAQATKYQDLFDNTYWGGFDDKDEDQNQSLVDNRNGFVEGFNVSEYCLCDTTGTFVDVLREVGCEVDHPEYYKTEDGKIIILCSNYGRSEKHLETNFGFTEYDKLYATGATTYMRVFDSEYSVAKETDGLKAYTKFVTDF